jgi:hypothetical protein
LPVELLLVELLPVELLLVELLPVELLLVEVRFVELLLDVLLLDWFLLEEPDEDIEPVVLPLESRN